MLKQNHNKTSAFVVSRGVPGSRFFVRPGDLSVLVALSSGTRGFNEATPKRVIPQEIARSYRGPIRGE